MYAIVKTGGKQYKVAEGDVIEVEKLVGAPGDAVSLSAVLVVDGADVVTDSAALANVAVTGEVVAHTKGPKIHIHKFKNKTGYHKRQGHRQPLTSVVVRDISKGRRRHGTQEGRLVVPQRSRLERPAPRREALRRPGRQGRRDHRASARDPLPPGPRCRSRWRRHAVRARVGCGHLRHAPGTEDRLHLRGRVEGPPFPTPCTLG